MSRTRDELNALRAEVAAMRDRELKSLRRMLEQASARATRLDERIDQVAHHFEVTGTPRDDFDRVNHAVGQLQREAAELRSELALTTNHFQAAMASRADIDRLIVSVDLLKSAAEVPREWFDELQQWRAANSLPDRPLVSVCVATYQRSRELAERCLASLVRQTYDHLEIIVVSDGPSPTSAAAVESVDDPRVRLVELPERGGYPADPDRRWMVAGTAPMNHALSIASGELITHLDDDDEHLPDRVEKLVATFTETGADVVFHPFWRETDDGAWLLVDATDWRLGSVTTSSVMYRSWFSSVPWDVDAHLLGEPGDWNRFRKFRYLGAKCVRTPEPLLRHYRERTAHQPRRDEVRWSG